MDTIFVFQTKTCPSQSCIFINRANTINVLVHSSQALEDAYLAIDGRITTEEVIKELVQIAGRPQEETANEKVADEDDGELVL